MVGYITRRGNSYLAQVSIYKNGKSNRLTKTFKHKADAKRWVLENELSKANGKDLANTLTSFAEFFENWIHLVKRNDVKETTFQNYMRTAEVIKELFGDIRLKDLNDIMVQKRIDTYAETHSRKTTHEVLLKIKTALRDAYARGYIVNDFAGLVKTRGTDPPKRNRALSITEFKKLRHYILKHPENEFHILVLLALETGMRRGELLAIRPESLYEYGVQVRHSISPTSTDTSLKTNNAKRDISINKEVYNLVQSIPVKSNGYIFDFDAFKQSERLATLLEELNISRTTFHGLRDTHASFLFSQDIDLVYVSKRLGHVNIQTTQNYYLELMPEKKHEQEDIALNLLRDL
ncbi:tyrosine-type recombinase/integrase [Virgibacillus alimentarius]|uniref:tyrosine-type recombinase/integrase n=1 Tax=Virgibacillus alimentarius TaxID=698769 RepID=UPI00049300CF